MDDRFSAIGHIVIKDAETGETLADSHNMIVKGGRGLIAGAAFGGTPLDIKDFHVYFEENDSSETTSDDTYSGKSAYIVNADDLSKATIAYTTDASLTDNVTHYAYNSTAMTAEFKHRFTDTSKNRYITAAGLAYKKGTADPILFSRVMFDPVYMRSNRSYIVDYTVKF